MAGYGDERWEDQNVPKERTGKEGKSHMKSTNYIFVEEKDFTVFHQVWINERDASQNNETVTTRKEQGVLLIPYHPCKLLSLVAQVKEKKQMAHMSVVLSAPDFPLIEELIKMDVFHFYSNVHSGDALFQLWKETHTMPSFVDIPFHKYLRTIALGLDHWKTFRPNHDLVMDPDKEWYQLTLEEEPIKNYLSHAEIHVVQEMMKGKSNKQIAEDLYLARATVNNHVSRISHKLSAKNKAHLLKRLIEMKLVTLEEINQ
ncbi:LuxR C-terminal-related transcriptional regulator [Bacillus sp. FJAT-44742]|uniref:LuxR C-terminal-related transcriptional regulator n=1 Tax=Bacillus sp. FJAT-44742 TaxID=2014005 RepID=UPI0018E1FA36|nr:LuxR C-terminal-related transcriptional regulator [Bacillus sp. FJAT-44742]